MIAPELNCWDASPCLLVLEPAGGWAHASHVKSETSRQLPQKLVATECRSVWGGCLFLQVSGAEMISCFSNLLRIPLWPKGLSPAACDGRGPRMSQIWTFLIAGFNIAHKAWWGKAKIHCEIRQVWSWDSQKRERLRFFSCLILLSVTGNVMARHRSQKDLFLWRENQADSWIGGV